LPSCKVTAGTKGKRAVIWKKIGGKYRGKKRGGLYPSRNDKRRLDLVAGKHVNNGIGKQGAEKSKANSKIAAHAG